METAKKSIKIFLAWLPVIILSALILYQSTLPWPYISKSLVRYDKIIHGVIYFVFATFVARAFEYGKINRLWCYLMAALLFTCLFGALDEWVQHYFAWRKTDFFDWVADAVGASLGVTFYWYWSGGRKNITPETPV